MTEYYKDNENFTIEQLKDNYFYKIIEHRNIELKIIDLNDEKRECENHIDDLKELIFKKTDEEDERISNLCEEERIAERRRIREEKQEIKRILESMKEALKENAETINKYKIPHELI